MTGVVKFFKQDRGFGFLIDSVDPKLEYFFHIKDFSSFTVKATVQRGDLLEYELGLTTDGPKKGTTRAVKLVMLDVDKS